MFRLSIRVRPGHDQHQADQDEREYKQNQLVHERRIVRVHGVGIRRAVRTPDSTPNPSASFARVSPRSPGGLSRNFLASPPSSLSSPGNHMEYRVLGKTGWKVSVLGFGAAPLGGTHGAFSERDGIRAVHTAIELGMNFIDVAPYYGLTMAESVLGKALQEIPREKFLLATKVGRYGADEKDFDFSAGRIVRSVDDSLKRLRVAHIDLIQCQDVEFATTGRIVDEALPT